MSLNCLFHPLSPRVNFQHSGQSDPVKMQIHVIVCSEHSWGSRPQNNIVSRALNDQVPLPFWPHPTPFSPFFIPEILATWFIMRTQPLIIMPLKLTFYHSPWWFLLVTLLLIKIYVFKVLSDNRKAPHNTTVKYFIFTPAHLVGL